MRRRGAGLATAHNSLRNIIKCIQPISLPTNSQSKISPIEMTLDLQLPAIKIKYHNFWVQYFRALLIIQGELNYLQSMLWVNTAHASATDLS